MAMLGLGAMLGVWSMTAQSKIHAQDNPEPLIYKTSEKVTGEGGPRAGLSPERLIGKTITIKGKAQNTPETGAVITAGDYLVYLGVDKGWSDQFLDQTVIVSAKMLEAPLDEDGKVDVDKLHELISELREVEPVVWPELPKPPVTTQPADPNAVEGEVVVEGESTAEGEVAETQPTTQPTTQPVDPMDQLKYDLALAKIYAEGKLLANLSHGIINEAVKGPRYIAADVEIRVKYEGQDELVQKYLIGDETEEVEVVETVEKVEEAPSNLLDQIRAKHGYDVQEEVMEFKGEPAIAFIYQDGIQPYVVPQWQAEAYELISVIGGQLAELEALRAEEEERRRLELEALQTQPAPEFTEPDPIEPEVTEPVQPVVEEKPLEDDGPYWNEVDEAHGVKIGMTKEEVLKAIGKPLGEFQLTLRRDRLDYLDLDLTKPGPSPYAMLIDFKDDKVIRIRVPKKFKLIQLQPDGSYRVIYVNYGVGGYGIPPFPIFVPLK